MFDNLIFFLFCNNVYNCCRYDWDVIKKKRCMQLKKSKGELKTQQLDIGNLQTIETFATSSYGYQQDTDFSEHAQNAFVWKWSSAYTLSALSFVKQTSEVIVSRYIISDIPLGVLYYYSIVFINELDKKPLIYKYTALNSRYQFCNPFILNS